MPLTMPVGTEALTARGRNNSLGDCTSRPGVADQEMLMQVVYGFNFFALIICYFLIRGLSRHRIELNLQQATLQAGKRIMKFIAILLGVNTIQVVSYEDCYWFGRATSNTLAMGSVRTVVISVLVSLGVVLADSLMVYRCFMIWNRRWTSIAIPLPLLITSVVTNIIFDTSKDFPHQKAFFITSIGLSVAINLITSILICVKLLPSRHERKQRPSPSRSLDVTLAMLFIPAVAYYIVIAISQAYLLATNDPEQAVGPLTGQISCMAATLLALQMGFIYYERARRTAKTQLADVSLDSEHHPGQLSEPSTFIMSSRKEEGLPLLEASENEMTQY